jgi:hypothetical protein
MFISYPLPISIKELVPEIASDIYKSFVEIKILELLGYLKTGIVIALYLVTK